MGRAGRAISGAVRGVTRAVGGVVGGVAKAAGGLLKGAAGIGTGILGAGLGMTGLNSVLGNNGGGFLSALTGPQQEAEQEIPPYEAGPYSSAYTPQPNAAGFYNKGDNML